MRLRLRKTQSQHFSSLTLDGGFDRLLLDDDAAGRGVWDSMAMVAVAKRMLVERRRRAETAPGRIEGPGCCG